MTLRLDHIGIAVSSLEERLRFWADALGIEVDRMETVDSEQVKVALLPVGESQLELIEATSEESSVGRFVRKRGEGIHHLTLAVDDIEATLERLRAKGAETVGKAPRVGAGGSKIAFLHPRSTGGVLLELVERAPARPAKVHEIVPGAVVLAYLRDPQEKMWGVLRKLDQSGAVLEAIDLGSFDDWVSQLERGEESVVGPSLLFVPIGRVEKLLLDRSSGHLPSLAERFERSIGRSVLSVLDATES